jgi:hypothetical protein
MVAEHYSGEIELNAGRSDQESWNGMINIERTAIERHQQVSRYARPQKGDPLLIRHPAEEQ